MGRLKSLADCRFKIIASTDALACQILGMKCDGSNAGASNADEPRFLLWKFSTAANRTSSPKENRSIRNLSLQVCLVKWILNNFLDAVLGKPRTSLGVFENLRISAIARKRSALCQSRPKSSPRRSRFEWETLNLPLSKTPLSKARWPAENRAVGQFASRI